jgi:UDPglucose--hexose-1-phosphate uridylyltransferase
MFSRKKKEKQYISELRKDLVLGDWVLMATGRKKRPQNVIKRRREKPQPIAKCPFESSRINNKDPLLWYVHPSCVQKDDIEEWFVQVIENKYPALIPHAGGVCPVRGQYGLYRNMPGVGYHEVIVTRPHEQSIGQMSVEEVAFIIRAYRERYIVLKSDNCIAYILVFHNHGKEAGASISHPHSQLIALPIIPPDVKRSFKGSKQFFERIGKCIHCYMLEWEQEDKKRIVYENEAFIALAPYASRISFEVRIYPKKHNPHFEMIREEEILQFADVLTVILGRMNTVLADPAYNFYIHTAPVINESVDYYHWHMEILPKTSVPAGLELGTGVDVVVVAPEEVPQLLRTM